MVLRTLWTLHPQLLWLIQPIVTAIPATAAVTVATETATVTVWPIRANNGEAKDGLFKGKVAALLLSPFLILNNQNNERLSNRTIGTNKRGGR